jgi:hypothetical protein
LVKVFETIPARKKNEDRAGVLFSRSSYLIEKD